MTRRVSMMDSALPMSGQVGMSVAQTPVRVLPGQSREGTVYHFLLPDSGMVAYADRNVKALAQVA